MRIWTKRLVPLALHGMESSSSARLTDKKPLHAKVRFSHVLVNKPLVIFYKTRTGLNLCNKQFNCTSKFLSDLYLLGPITLSPFCTQQGGAGSAARHDKQNYLREGRGSTHPLSSSRSKVSSFLWRPCMFLSLMKGSEEVTYPNEWLPTFQWVRAGRLVQSSFSQRICSVGEQ